MANDPSDQIKKFLIIFIIGVFIIKGAGSSGFFTPTSYRGKGYKIKIPLGWKQVKKQKDDIYPEGVDVVMFVQKEVDVKKEDPKNYITVYSKKLTTPIWIADEFPDILNSIRQAGYKVMDKGEIKVDKKIAKWIVYHDARAPALVLEFYIVSDNNTFIKMQYTAHPDQFNVLRRSFEELKDSFKFRFGFY